jgi:hypothetical protein
VGVHAAEEKADMFEFETNHKRMIWTEGEAPDPKENSAKASQAPSRLAAISTQQQRTAVVDRSLLCANGHGCRILRALHFDIHSTIPETIESHEK